MKTSNILLLVFFLAMLLIPLTLLLSLRAKIGTSDYTTLQYDLRTTPQASPSAMRALPPCRVLVIRTSSPDEFNCHLIPDSLAYYTTGDSMENRNLEVIHTGDTLLMRFLPGQRVRLSVGGEKVKRAERQRELSIDLHLPGWSRLEIDGASVSVDSAWNDMPTRDVLLTHSGHLQLEEGYNGHLHVMKAGTD